MSEIKFIHHVKNLSNQKLEIIKEYKNWYITVKTGPERWDTSVKFNCFLVCKHCHYVQWEIMRKAKKQDHRTPKCGDSKLSNKIILKVLMFNA